MKRKTLFFLAILLYSSIPFVQGQNRDLDDDLVAYYNFDDSTATDESGNGHNGTVFGSVPMMDWENGKYAVFNGNYNNYIKVPHHQDLNFSDDFSISCWINWIDIPGPDVLIAKGRDIYSNYSLRPNNFWMGYDGVYGHWVGTSGTIDQNSWHHIVGVADKANHLMKFYIDGVLADSEYLPDFNITTTYPLIIGRHFTNSNGGGGYQYPFQGKVDEIRIYNKALTESEIQQLYNLNDPNGSPTPSVPINNWAIVLAIFLMVLVLWRKLF